MDLLKNIFKGDKVIWIIFLCLCLISIVEVFSAASTLTYKSGDHWGPITQHSIILMVGAVVVVFLHNVPYKWFQVFPVFLYPISLVLLAFVTLMGILTGDRGNGAARLMTFMGALLSFVSDHYRDRGVGPRMKSKGHYSIAPSPCLQYLVLIFLKGQGRIQDVFCPCEPCPPLAPGVSGCTRGKNVVYSV